jgi:hypothetical protein
MRREKRPHPDDMPAWKGSAPEGNLRNLRRIVRRVTRQAGLCGTHSGPVLTTDRGIGSRAGKKTAVQTTAVPMVSLSQCHHRRTLILSRPLSFFSESAYKIIYLRYH